MAVSYDTIGVDYAALGRPDPRIARRILDTLGTASKVLNVGAGTGSYEPADRQVVAIEPSEEMIRQRGPGTAPAIQGVAEKLPFADREFDASMAILTIHHWADKALGLSEMRRVTRGRIVIVTFDPAHPGTWLGDYLPQLRELDAEQMPPMEFYADHLRDVEASPLAVPRDCTDGFLYAYWARPEAYLDPRIRRGSSSFWALPDTEAGLASLQRDLESGEWDRRYGHLRDMDAFDVGYRLVLSTAPAGTEKSFDRSPAHERTA